MKTKVWLENEVLGEQYVQFLDAEVKGVTMDECVENRIAEITYCISRLSAERMILEDSDNFNEKLLTVGMFLKGFDRNPSGIGSDMDVYVDNYSIFDSDIMPEFEKELRNRHVDSWWNENGDMIIVTIEGKLLEQGVL